MPDSGRPLDETAEIMERIIHLYIQHEKKPRYYGTDDKLTRAEIHTINMIGQNTGINITDLSQLRGITKGAMSQMIYRLVKKGYVSKNVSEQSDSEVALSLTKKGELAYEAHLAFHKTSQQPFFDQLRNLSDTEYTLMVNLLKSFEEMLTNTVDDH